MVVPGKNRFNFAILAVALFVAPALLAQNSPERDLETLFNASHGFTPMSGQEAMDIWAGVKANPEPYLPYLEAAMDLNTFETGTRTDRARARVSAWVLGQLKHSRASLILAQCFHLIGTRMEIGQPRGPLTAVQKDMVRLRRGILDALGEKGDVQLVGTCRNSFEHEDVGTQIVMRRYLRRVDPEWRSSLRDEEKK